MENSEVVITITRREDESHSFKVQGTITKRKYTSDHK